MELEVERQDQEEGQAEVAGQSQCEIEEVNALAQSRVEWKV